ncbi:MAG: hypothetical protein IKL85_07775 [Lentisphaeria bacterium]|nr:hypothetical protein [Lentisphaeria bacterium]
MGKYFSPKETNTDPVWNQAVHPRRTYSKVATNLNTVIVCGLFLGPIVFILFNAFEPTSKERFLCLIAAIILGIIIIVSLSSAAENYMSAKDAERDEIVEKLEQINSNIEWFNKSEVQILERLSQGEPEQ